MNRLEKTKAAVIAELSQKPPVEHGDWETWTGHSELQARCIVYDEGDRMMEGFDALNQALEELIAEGKIGNVGSKYWLLPSPPPPVYNIDSEWDYGSQTQTDRV